MITTYKTSTLRLERFTLVHTRSIDYTDKELIHFSLELIAPCYSNPLTNYPVLLSPIVVDNRNKKTRDYTSINAMSNVSSSDYTKFKAEIFKVLEVAWIHPPNKLRLHLNV